MWLLDYLPNDLLNIIAFVLLAVGIMLYAAAFFIKFLPPNIQIYREPMKIGGAVLVVAGVYCYGMYQANSEWQHKVDQAEQKVAIAEKQAADTSAKIEYVYQDRIQIVHDRQTKVSESIKTEATKIDATCNVDAEAISILNSAASQIVTVSQSSDSGDNSVPYDPTHSALKDNP
jgi:hypothetical protein